MQNQFFPIHELQLGSILLFGEAKLVNLVEALLVLHLMLLAKGQQHDCIAVEVKPVAIDESFEFEHYVRGKSG